MTKITNNKISKTISKKILNVNINLIESYLLYKNIPMRNRNNINNLLNNIKLYIGMTNINNKQLNFMFYELNNLVIELYYQLGRF
jgi:hypothetical protein